jgi:hypothetical protein
MKKLFASLVLCGAALSAAAVPAVADPGPAAPAPVSFVTAKQCKDAGGKAVSGTFLTGQVCRGGKSDGAWIIPGGPAA